MDYIIGILLVIICILILINFASVSISDNQPGIPLLPSNNYNTSNTPSPVLSRAPSALNNKINLENQTYDYSKYFYV